MPTLLHHAVTQNGAEQSVCLWTRFFPQWCPFLLRTRSLKVDTATANCAKFQEMLHCNSIRMAFLSNYAALWKSKSAEFRRHCSALFMSVVASVYIHLLLPMHKKKFFSFVRVCWIRVGGVFPPLYGLFAENVHYVVSRTPALHVINVLPIATFVNVSYPSAQFVGGLWAQHYGGKANSYHWPTDARRLKFWSRVCLVRYMCSWP